MFTKFRVLAMVTALGLGLGVASSGAQAGPQYVDKTGYAASGYDVVAYHALPQSEAGQSQPKAVAGKTVFEAEWNGAKWAFARRPSWPIRRNTRPSSMAIVRSA
jgi:hypothetical protein